MQGAAQELLIYTRRGDYGDFTFAAAYYKDSAGLEIGYRFPDIGAARFDRPRPAVWQKDGELVKLPSGSQMRFKVVNLIAA